MAEQSYNFDFSRVDDFFENFNIKFLVSDMNKYDASGDLVGTAQSDFQLVLASYCPTNISDCLDSNGKLDTSAVTIAKDSSNNDLIEDIGLDWIKDANGDGSIELTSACTFTIGDVNVPLKGVFLRTKDSNKYVMGYSISPVAFSVTNKVVFDEDVIFWNISRFKSDGE